MNHFFSKVKDHQTFDIQKFMTEMIDGIGSVFDMLMGAYSKKLWKHIHDTFVVLFIQLVITFSVKYPKNEQEKFTKRLESEIELINDFFDGKTHRKDFEENKEKLNRSL